MTMQEMRQRVRDHLYSSMSHIEFEDDLIDALKHDYGISNKIAQKIFDMAWEEGHSGGYMDILIYANQYGRFALEVIKSIKN